VVLSLHQVTVRHGSVVALDIADVSFDSGSLVALIGPNGSGKTTLLDVIAGLHSPLQGQVHWSTSRTGVASVGHRQQPTTWMPLSAGEVLAFERLRGKGLFRRLGDQDHAALTRAAQRLEVSEILDQRYRALSFGQRQRIHIASALASDAPVILLDEPITGLDLPSQKVILDAIAEERDNGRLIIFSTHHLDEARRCDRVLVLANRVVADGPPEQALRAEALTTAFHGRVLTLDGQPVLLDDHGHDHHGPDHHGHDHHGGEAHQHV